VDGGAEYVVSSCPLGGKDAAGIDLIDQVRKVAAYVDQILKGEDPANLPVQEPAKFELVINLKTVKALGITVPPRHPQMLRCETLPLIACDLHVGLVRSTRRLPEPQMLRSCPRGQSCRPQFRARH
jgi:hypothetical protein